MILSINSIASLHLFLSKFLSQLIIVFINGSIFMISFIIQLTVQPSVNRCSTEIESFP